MKKIMMATGAAVALSVALSGCTPTTEKAYTGTAPAAPTVWTGSPAPAHSNAGGEHGEGRSEGATLNAYITANKIAEIPFKKDDPGTPKLEFPLPPDWSPAGDRTPDWAYGAIVYDKAPDPENPPFMYAIASKLTGNVDPAKILELAPGQLNELPGFVPREAPHSDKVSGFDAIDYVGTYMWEGQRRLVGQQTIVIPGKDALFVLQLNGEAPEGQGQPVVDAVKLINEQTKITLPS
ncbi:LpqN/LpqT family lipoprotein [Mycolicibacterium sp.]|uniref:LpqN/LpqT family lipoprotein n=1 Tax=Mycolicibacterium sp. TaxID=2320850 RepID=UPI0025CC9544|nr:LpqN/LpqT family lipoprotein [Mycolicibacterium sp.]